MGFDDVKLVLCELAWFFQDCIRDQQLADIVEQPTGSDKLLVICGQIQPVGENIADERDVQRMVEGRVIVVFHG